MRCSAISVSSRGLTSTSTSFYYEKLVEYRSYIALERLISSPLCPCLSPRGPSEMPFSRLIASVLLTDYPNAIARCRVARISEECAGLFQVTWFLRPCAPTFPRREALCSVRVRTIAAHLHDADSIFVAHLRRGRDWCQSVLIEESCDETYRFTEVAPLGF